MRRSHPGAIGQRRWPENPTTFNDDPTGPTPPFPPGLKNSTVCDSAYCGPIQFATDGAVANGTTGGVAAEPAGDTSNYLWGVNGLNPLGFQGSEVIFNPPNGKDGPPNSFNIYWGSIDALMTNPDGTPRYDNTLTVFTASPVNTQDSVTGSQLAAAGVFGVNGFGSQTSANDNQWFNIRDTAGRSSSSQPARRETRLSSTWAQACLSRRPGR